MPTKRKVDTASFLRRHPVFSLEQAADFLAPAGGRAATVARLKHHLRTGALKRVAREVYAVVPPGQAVEGFQPDAFLAARALRPEGIFSHHSALELLGAAHSVWRQCTVYADRRRPPLVLGQSRVLFLAHPSPLRRSGEARLGTVTVEWQGEVLRATGPERTLVECLRRPDLAGGLGEVMESVLGFPVLDLGLLSAVLSRYGMGVLWGAAGWLLEVNQATWDVPGNYLEQLEQHRPPAPRYLIRDTRGGVLMKRWNVIVPREVAQPGTVR